MKYKNVIFDFGNVLIRFSPEAMVKKYVSDSEDIRILTDSVFYRPMWSRLDIGSISDDEFKAWFYDKLPERLHDIAERIYDEWVLNLPETEGMRDLVTQLKKDGCKVYVLSNISKYFSDNADKSPILSLFDGVVLSADIALAKPDKAIYEYICNKYSLCPSETLFIDDSADNIAGAADFGLCTWLFTFNVQELKAHIYN